MMTRGAGANKERLSQTTFVTGDESHSARNAVFKAPCPMPTGGDKVIGPVKLTTH